MERIRVAVLGPLTIYRQALQQALVRVGFDVAFAGSWTDCPVDETINISLLVANEWDNHVVADLRRVNPRSHIVIISGVFHYQKLRMAFELEVSGYLLRELSFECLVGLLRLVALGEKVFPSQLGETLRKQVAVGEAKMSSPAPSASLLSKRELDIVRCLIAGHPNKAISRRLMISEATVKVHIKSILRKLHLANRTQVALWGIEAGIAGDLLQKMAEQH